MDAAAALSILQQHRANRAAEGFRDADGEIKPLEVATAPELSGLGVGALVRRLFAQQEERVRVYRRFEQGFAQFLEVAEAEGYDALVADATAAFAQVSAGVNAVEAALLASGADGAAFAALVRRLQELEREKLTATAQEQIVRHGLAVDKCATRRATTSASRRGGWRGCDARRRPSSWRRSRG